MQDARFESGLDNYPMYVYFIATASPSTVADIVPHHTSLVCIQ